MSKLTDHEILQALEDGKSIRRAHWAREGVDARVKLDEYGKWVGLLFRNGELLGKLTTFLGSYLLNEDWEVCEPSH